MLRKEKRFDQVYFKDITIHEAINLFFDKIDPKRDKTPKCRFSVEIEGETWTSDSLEDFLKSYLKSPNSASINIFLENSQINLYYYQRGTTINVEAKEHSTIQSIFDIFEKQRQTSLIAPVESSSTIAKIKRYKNTFFPAEVIKEAYELFLRLLDPEGKQGKRFYLDIDTGEEEWKYNNPDDFFYEYRKSPSSAVYDIRLGDSDLRVAFQRLDTSVNVESRDRKLIHSLFDVFEKHKKASKIADASFCSKIKPKIFIGHGRSPLWKELKDHLHEKHEYPIEAYEIGARAGHSIRDILESMLKESTFALLVMTGENKPTGNQSRARDNVIHELGLFQGKLGFNRAIVLLEKGTKEFSNIAGIQQIRFMKGNIKEVFGDILATLKREFPNTSK